MARTGNSERKRNAGMFRPGQSGNPSGRPKQTPQERDFLDLCRVNAPAAMAAVLGVLADPDARPADRLRAAEFIADRAYGKPVNRDVLISMGAGESVEKLTDAQLLAQLRVIEGGLAENSGEIKELDAPE